MGKGALVLIRSYTSLVQEPSIEPLDLVLTKQHLRFTASSEDGLIDQWISAARLYFETQTGRQLMTARWDYTLDRWPDQRALELPYPPLRSVVSVTYRDDAGQTQVFDAANYRVLMPVGPFCARGRLVLVDGATWPSTIREEGAVTVRFDAGYGAHTGSVPELTKTVLYMLVSHFHKFRGPAVTADRRENVQAVPFGVAAMLGAFKSRPELLPRCTG